MCPTRNPLVKSAAVVGGLPRALPKPGAKARGSDSSEELGELYFNRMLRYTGIKEYEAQVAGILKETSGREDQAALAVVA
jgi:hypothetical protein